MHFADLPAMNFSGAVAPRITGAATTAQRRILYWLPDTAERLRVL